MNEYEDEEVHWDWNRNPKQDIFIADRSREACFVGGRGSTKTSSTVFRIYTTCYDPITCTVRPEWRGARIAMFAPIAKQLKRGPLDKFDEIMGNKGFGLIEKSVNGHDPRREMVGDIILYAFNVGTDGSGVEATRGAEYAICWLDEAAQMPEKTYALADTLLRQKRRGGKFYGHQLIITSTPRGKNWMHTNFMSLVPKGLGLWHRDNKLIVRGSTQESIDAEFVPEGYGGKYTPGTLMYEQEKMGETIAWGGLVFPDFDFDSHVYDASLVTAPPLKYVYGGIDIGTSDPTAILVGGVDAQNATWIVDEFYNTRARFDDWADLVGSWDRKFSVREWEVDSDLTVRMLKHAGIRARTPYKAKDAAAVSINFINNQFAKGQIHISSKCVNLIRELESYHHKEGDYDPRTQEQTILSTIQPNQDDHAIDAFRYLILPLSSASAAQNYNKTLEFSIA